ncbi:hypothetical protein [Streptomyces hydrogenans]|uniref:Uncharacterized protein n=1 Tax=Streptomyces hydrogenans TaxID=1873719 RepID=A0ABQ3PKT6_9ACTN|nr:hypothetical protein [Streptomyces hydrogenans]GHG35425.1 hypothetical protein GCM10018784_56160 [Streptomyces hydrogenans]GHI23365.1 hypothetical protein Shyd_47360 [Streptomyces hydrogenans]GHI25414.1 hypothetical protein Shyd_67850 [Streptomyces hydrogenans]GHI25478.1 hypothetical protein Shyd_68490 [Streptomyces hydrogenans]GHI25550.1 hypothetical protein Shyd_69210 [Streptomyces hydrogenans]
MNINQNKPSEPLLSRLHRRIRPQRRVAAGHFLRGLAYGTGLSVASALAYGLRQMW